MNFHTQKLFDQFEATLISKRYQYTKRKLINSFSGIFAIENTKLSLGAQTQRESERFQSNFTSFFVTLNNSIASIVRKSIDTLNSKTQNQRNIWLSSTFETCFTSIARLGSDFNCIITWCNNLIDARFCFVLFFADQKLNIVEK